MKILGDQKIGVIGVGNMGASIMEGVLAKCLTTPSRVCVYDKDATKSGAFARKYRTSVAPSLAVLLQRSDVILLAMKPQDFFGFAAEYRGFFHAKQTVISILAGMTTQKIAGALGKNISIVRAMPNLGAKVGQSMTVICGKDRRSLVFASLFFSGCGEVAVLPEKSLDLVTAVSGSGPAYFFHMMELMGSFGVKHGLPASVARMLAVQTGLGAALLAKGSTLSCATLREMVTSKKGTTDAALKTLKRKKFAAAFHRALAAAMDRSRQLREGK